MLWSGLMICQPRGLCKEATKNYSWPRICVFRVFVICHRSQEHTFIYFQHFSHMENVPYPNPPVLCRCQRKTDRSKCKTEKKGGSIFLVAFFFFAVMNDSKKEERGTEEAQTWRVDWLWSIRNDVLGDDRYEKRGQKHGREGSDGFIICI